MLVCTRGQVTGGATGRSALGPRYLLSVERPALQVSRSYIMRRRLDVRYRAIADDVVNRFARHLGPRLTSAFVKGSVARDDAVWGVSDLDLVLAFDAPSAADTALKRDVEEAVRRLAGGEALVIMRIAEDRLQEMSPGVRAYWLYSCWYDSQVLSGPLPSSLLPAPPSGRELVRLIAPIRGCVALERKLG